jgi:ornithine carbamoyltransferase
MQLGRGETSPTPRVLRHVDAIMIRILNHNLVELATHATVPVINGLTRLSHPCQVMADVMTFEEHKGSIRGHTVAWTGDANNVLSSWMHAAKSFDFRLRVATPPELKPEREIAAWAKQSGAAIEIGHEPEQAVAEADCVVTDTWVSMGDRDGERRHNLLKPYQVNARLMACAKPDAIFMHCLPAHRGDEVTDEVIDGPQSVVFDEAENRLHAEEFWACASRYRGGSNRAKTRLAFREPIDAIRPRYQYRAPARFRSTTPCCVRVAALDLRGRGCLDRSTRYWRAQLSAAGRQLLGEAILLGCCSAPRSSSGPLHPADQDDGPVPMLVVDFMTPGKVRSVRGSTRIAWPRRSPPAGPKPAYARARISQ